MSERTFSFYAKNLPPASTSGQCKPPTFIARNQHRRNNKDIVAASPFRGDLHPPDRLLHPQLQTYNVSHFQERQIKVNSGHLSDSNNNRPPKAEHKLHRSQERLLSSKHSGPIRSSTQLVVKPSSNCIPVSVEIHTPIPTGAQKKCGNHRSSAHHNPNKRQRTASSASSMTIFSIPGDSQCRDSQHAERSGAVSRYSDTPLLPSHYKLGNGYVPSPLVNDHLPGLGELSGKSLETIAEELNPAPKQVRIDMGSVSRASTKLTSSRNVKLAGKSFLSHSQNEAGQEIEALPLDLRAQDSKRRRSSLLSLDLKFFKNKITASHASVGQSNRTSIISRLSFSSEYDPTIRVTNFNKLTDLRRILSPEEEKEDWLDVFWSKFNTCDWFEWNLNNAAKLITLAVFLVTILLIIRAIVNGM